MIWALLAKLKDRFTTDWRQIDWPRTGLLILLILAVFAALWQFFMPEVRTITTTQFKRVPEIQKAADIPRVRVTCPEQGFVALDKKEVAEKLDMPWLQGGDIASAKNDKDNSSGEVITPSAEDTLKLTSDGEIIAQSPVPGRPAALQPTSTADLPESDNGYYVVSVVNTDTGITMPVVKEKDSPWFQLENHGSLGLFYGFNLKLQQTAQGDLTWKFLRIKDAHLGLKGDGGTDGTGHALAGILYEW